MIFQTLNLKPAASLDHFTPEILGSAELAEEVQVGSSKVVKVSEFWVVIIQNCFLLFFLQKMYTVVDDIGSVWLESIMDK